MASDVTAAGESVPEPIHSQRAMLGDSSVSLIGPDPDSKLLDLPLMAGRWLKPDDDAVAVINQAVLARDPSLHLGGEI